MTLKTRNSLRSRLLWPSITNRLLPSKLLTFFRAQPANLHARLRNLGVGLEGVEDYRFKWRRLHVWLVVIYLVEDVESYYALGFGKHLCFEKEA